MKLYYTKGACSLVDRIIINELGLKCEYESVDLKKKETETKKDFLTINPKGAVPVLQLSNGEILTENAVIIQYLADNARADQLLPAIGNFERYRVLEWVNYVATEVHKSFGPLFNPTVPQQIKDDIFIPLIKSKYKYVNKHLQGNKFLLGEHFTLPDAYMFVMILWASHFNIDMKEYEHLYRYYSELKQRESVQKSLEEEG